MTQQQQLDSNKQFFYKKIFKKSLNICICQNTNTKYIDISDGLLNYKKVYINYIVLFFKRTIGNLCVCVCVYFPKGSALKKKKKKKSTCSTRVAEDLGSIPGLGRSPGGGHGNPLQYSYLENPMEREA